MGGVDSCSSIRRDTGQVRSGSGLGEVKRGAFGRWADTVKHSRQADHHFPLANDPNARLPAPKKITVLSAPEMPAGTPPNAMPQPALNLYNDNYLH